MGKELPQKSSLTLAKNDVFSFQAVTKLEDIIECWSVARSRLLTEHYGLSASRFLPKEYLHLLSHRYFRVSYQGEPVGIVRVIPSISMGNYLDNLTTPLVYLIKKGIRFSDIGFYCTRDLSSFVRSHLIRELLVFSKSLSLSKGIGGLYIQVPTKHESFYQHLGFHRAGLEFQPPGWNKTYVPMYLLCKN